MHQTTIERRCFHPDGRPKILSEEDITALSKALERLAPSIRRKLERRIEEAFFKDEEIQVAMKVEQAVELWALINKSA